jgi:hypothetical protein
MTRSLPEPVCHASRDLAGMVSRQSPALKTYPLWTYFDNVKINSQALSQSFGAVKQMQRNSHETMYPIYEYDVVEAFKVWY